MLRKHIATVCILLEISEHEVNDLADFMGHHEKIHKSHYRQSVVTKDLAISRLLKYAQGEDITDESDKDTTDESDTVDEDENKDENEDDPTNDSNTYLSSNISDTSSLLITTRQQSKQLSSKEKNINVGRKEVNSLAPTKKIKYNTENVIESDEECNTELDLNISNTLSSKKTKQSKQVSTGKNNVNNSIKKKKTSPFGTTRKSTRKIRWTDDERTVVLSSFQTAIKNKTLPSFRKINEVKAKYPVFKGPYKCSDKNLVT
ncbi:hypothetical protein DMN91_004057 [Ooceraea biroi]|uniref:Uncharacterized protein n=2 Tax=Ooceraea biroi TaxID=2015173 RepID=A0A3L8DVA5_OOCBI|nr:hypothetical protein DMN91_004057 [Ooceraea biroi]